MGQDRDTGTIDTGPPPGVPPLPPGAAARPGAPAAPLGAQPPPGMPPLPAPAPAPPGPGTVATAPPAEAAPPRTKGPSWNQGDFGVWLPGERPSAAAPRDAASASTPTAPTATAPTTPVTAAPPAAPASARRSDVPKRLRVHSVALADPWRRIVARVVDWVVVVCFTLPLVLMALAVTDDPASTGGPSLTTVLLISLLGLFGPALYEIVGIAVWGRTIGKWLLGIRVVDARRGTVPGWSESTMRWVPTLVTLVPLVGGLLSLGLWIWALVNLWANSKRQTPFDLFAGTVVISDR
jgi:uncharacterized RDD family membrane protein YckC